MGSASLKSDGSPASEDPCDVLVIEDSAADRLLYRRMLEASNYSVSECSSAEDALVAITGSMPRCILLDHHLPGISGIELLRQLRSQYDEIPPTVIITGLADDAAALRAMQAGAHAFLTKAIVSVRTLRSEVAAALRAQRPERLRMVEAEYGYSCAAYTGTERVPDLEDLARFTIASQLGMLLASLKTPKKPSHLPNSLKLLGVRKK